MSKPYFSRLNVATRVAVLAVRVGAAIVGTMTAPAIRAQAPQAATRSASANTQRFEVVSIKPCKIQDTTDRGGKGGGGGRIRWDPGRLHEECQTLFNLIRDAYLAYPDGKPWLTVALGHAGTDDPEQVACTGCGDGLLPVSDRQFRQPIKGSPAWLTADRYTIDASKAEGSESMTMMRGPMMQALLEDRFKLKIHRESRDVPVYELTQVKGGPKPKTASEGSCIPDGREPPFLPSREHPLPASAMECGRPFPSPDGLDFNGTTIANLCRLLSGWADRDVIDKTGLGGMFDFHFDILPTEPPDDGTLMQGAPGPRPTDNPALFASMINGLAKLGLKLTPAKAQSEFLVIDHVERPTGN
jgi:uncharacterized protein (TIGR03435 family)